MQATTAEKKLQCGSLTYRCALYVNAQMALANEFRSMEAHEQQKRDVEKTREALEKHKLHPVRPGKEERAKEREAWLEARYGRSLELERKAFRETDKMGFRSRVAHLRALATDARHAADAAKEYMTRRKDVLKNVMGEEEPGEITAGLDGWLKMATQQAETAEKVARDAEALLQREEERELALEDAEREMAQDRDEKRPRIEA